MISRTHIVERENQLPQLSPDLHTRTVACMHEHTKSWGWGRSWGGNPVGSLPYKHKDLDSIPRTHPRKMPSLGGAPESQGGGQGHTWGSLTSVSSPAGQPRPERRCAPEEDTRGVFRLHINPHAHRHTYLQPFTHTCIHGHRYTHMHAHVKKEAVITTSQNH